MPLPPCAAGNRSRKQFRCSPRPACGRKRPHLRCRLLRTQLEVARAQNKRLRVASRSLKEDVTWYKREFERWSEWYLSEMRYEKARWKMMRVSSPLTRVHFWQDKLSEEEWDWRWWSSWCPCCKRPIDISVCADHTYTWEIERSLTPPRTPRYAYAASLWGASPGYVLGALVLGQAIRRRGSKHDLVLMHTDELPASSRRLLSQVWSLKPVQYITADANLFHTMGTRFDGVFTKLHALGLVEYTKVLMLDLDLAILQNVDELFELPAPAALHRGGTSLPHGSRIDGRRFFAGETLDEGSGAYVWGQCGGINAGVMLLEPSLELHQRALQEVSLTVHPERIPGAGPEQDYLSRLFAPSWTHISVIYNYQLHHVFFALENLVAHIVSGEADENPWTPERIELDTEDIHIVHFSGEVKMWDRDHFSGESDLAFAKRLLRNCAPHGSRLFLDRAAEDWEYEREGICRGSDGCCRPDGVSLEPAIEQGLKAVCTAAERAAKQWREDFEALPSSYPSLPALPEMVRQLDAPEWPADAAFEHRARVELSYRNDWYPATVTAVHEDGSFTVSFDDAGFWGTSARFVRASYLRLLAGDASGAET